MPHRVLKMAEEALGCALRVDGDIGLLERPRRALLFSRCERHPTPADPRIRAAIDATRRIVAARETLVAGTHRIPWDVALWTCRQNGGEAIVAIDEYDAPFEILPQNTLLVWPKNPTSLDKEARQKQRDRLVGWLANSAVAIHVRPGGNMAAIGDELTSRGGVVETWPNEKRISLLMPSQAHPSPPAPLPQGERGEQRRADKAQSISFADRLTHFTREPDGIWPGEAYSDYLNWLASGPTFIPRDGFQALRRILTERRIRACGRLIHSGAPMVCLTHRDPAELLAENRWRKGLARWTYSPYALSFRREDLEKLGARPVRYCPGDSMTQFPSDERRFLQIESSAGIDWRREAEWRIAGDLDFSALAPERILALTANGVEAQEISREFSIRALEFSREKP